MDRIKKAAEEIGVPEADLVTAFGMAKAVGECIRELGQVTSVRLYVEVMDVLSHNEYERIIELLVKSGLVTNDGRNLTWVGPVDPKGVIDE